MVSPEINLLGGGAHTGTAAYVYGFALFSVEELGGKPLNISSNQRF
jgi:hypothetical protein